MNNIFLTKHLRRCLFLLVGAVLVVSFFTPFSASAITIDPDNGANVCWDWAVNGSDLVVQLGDLPDSPVVVYTASNPFDVLFRYGFCLANI